MMDLEWLKNMPESGIDIDVGFNPFELGCNLQQGKGPTTEDVTGLLDIVAFWFVTVGVALKDLKDRIKIEVCEGDVVQVLEQIRNGVVGHRQQSEASPVTDLAATSSSAGQEEPKNDSNSSIASTSPISSTTIPGNGFDAESEE